MRQGSYGTQILKMVLEEAKKYNTDTQILDLRHVNLPLYDPDNTMLSDKPSTSKEDNNDNNNNNLATISNALKGPIQLSCLLLITTVLCPVQ
jgi:NAD(P)H-dependent FMN reductase